MSEARMLDLDAILPNAHNVRMDDSEEITELAQTIQRFGLLQPLTVVPSDVDGRYVLVAGHRRARALRRLGKTQAPCIVRPSVGLDDQTAMMLVENTQRKDLNPVEQAKALKVLKDSGMEQAQIAQMLGKSQAWVSYRLGILELSDDYLAKIAQGTITVAEAEQLVRENRAAAAGRGKGEKLDRGWEPPFFASHHPLAKKVKTLCDGRGHNNRRRVGNVGCGQCWEYMIRQDERTIVAVEQGMSPGVHIAPVSEGPTPAEVAVARTPRLATDEGDHSDHAHVGGICMFQNEQDAERDASEDGPSEVDLREMEEESVSG